MKDSSLKVCGSGLFVGKFCCEWNLQILLYKHKNSSIFLLCKVKNFFISHFTAHHSAVNAVNGGISKVSIFISQFSFYFVSLLLHFPSTLFNGLRQREGEGNIVIMRSPNNLKTYGNKNTH